MTKIPRRTHDLLELLDKCRKLDNEFSELADDASFLTTFYIEVRYPGGDTRIFDKRTVEEAVSAASRFRDFVSEKITSKE